MTQIRFAANLGMMFQEHAFLDRFVAAADVGFTGVEFPRLYGESISAVASALRASGLRLASFSMPRGNIARNERGLANDRRRTQEFREGLEWTIDAAAAFECDYIVCPIGNALDGVPSSEQFKVAAEHLHLASERSAASGKTVLIEPLNVFDHPEILLTTMAQARSLVDGVGHERLRILFDIYHVQRTEGNLTHLMAAHRDRIDYVQIADSPGRHQPGTGEINFDFVLGALAESQFAGWCGLEYRPAGGTIDSLSWLRGRAAMPTLSAGAC